MLHRDDMSFYCSHVHAKGFLEARGFLQAQHQPLISNNRQQQPDNRKRRMLPWAFATGDNAFPVVVHTFEPYLVRNTASSIAESPPPITARGFCRNIGAAPSQTAHALMPRFQKPPLPSCEPGNSIRFATAPARMN